MLGILIRMHTLIRGFEGRVEDSRLILADRLETWDQLIQDYNV